MVNSTPSTRRERDERGTPARATPALAAALLPTPNRRRAGPKSAAVRAAIQDAFIASFERLGIVTVACLAANIPRKTVYDWLEKDAAFAARYHQAEEQSADVLEAEAYRRAVQGVDKYVVSMGRIVMLRDPETGEERPLTERDYSDALLMKMLSARNKRYKPQVDAPSNGEGVQVVFMLPPQGAPPDGARTVEADVTPVPVQHAIAIEFPPLDDE